MRLTEAHRTDAPGLVAAIDDIRDGRVPHVGPGFEAREVVFADEGTAARLVLDAMSALSRRFSVPRLDILVLTPVNKFGPARAPALNEQLRPVLNPRSAGLASGQFAPGDRVVHIHNEYKELRRFNGETGTVAENHGDLLTVQYPDGRTDYEPEDVREFLRLAYVLSVHKGQGGQAPVVLVLLPRSAGRNLYRRLVYTAISRAELHTLVLAEPGMFARAVRNVAAHERSGNLAERIEKAAG